MIGPGKTLLTIGVCLAYLTGASLAASRQDSRSSPRGAPGRVSPLNDDEPNALVFSRFKFEGHMPTPDEWDTLPNGDENLLRYVSQVTNIKLSRKTWRERVVAVNDFDKMHTTPILFMTGQVDFDFTPEEVTAINEYFKRGGFLYADDCDADNRSGMLFYPAFLREIGKFPDIQVKRLPPNHELYHCFFDISAGHSPWDRAFPHQATWWDRFPDMGLYYRNRMVGLLTGSDQHCGWAGRRRNMQPEALKFGANIIVYALTH
ncbi:MAG: DUF4159 domain-containing protein [Candidatus Hydrogenedentes bacterium]|nr:DUF4159 domain-containing protein [Candidatus Hydrogenedentota bacterium]